MPTILMQKLLNNGDTSKKTEDNKLLPQKVEVWSLGSVELEDDDSSNCGFDDSQAS